MTNALVSDTNTYNKGVIGWCKMNYVNEYLIEWSEYYESDKSGRFYEALRRLNVRCSR